MKILQVTPAYKPAYIYGGPTFSVTLLCEQLAMQGNEVTVYTTTANGPDELDVLINDGQMIDGVKVHYFKRWTKDHTHLSPSLYVKLWRTAKDFDVIHIQSWWNLVAIPAVIICLLKGIHPVVSVRGTLSDYTFESSRSFIKKLLHFLIGKNLLKACFIHITSRKEEQECTRQLGPFKGFLIPNFLNLDAQASYSFPHPNNTKFTVAILSRIHPVKNLEFVFECFSQIDFDFEIKIIGSGDIDYVEDLKMKSRTLGLDDRIHWIGPKSGREKFELLAASDLFVQLSLTENFGNAIIEATSIGTPVLVSDQTGAAQHVRELNLGWVAKLDQAFVINLLNQIYDDQDARMSIRKMSPELVRKRFSGKYLAKEYINSYEKIVGKRALVKGTPPIDL